MSQPCQGAGRATDMVGSDADLAPTFRVRTAKVTGGCVLRVRSCERAVTSPRCVLFVVPAVLLTSTIGLSLFIGTYALHLVQLGAFGARNPAQLLADYPAAQTTLTAFLVLCGLFLIIFVEPPTGWWEGGATTRGDWRPTILALALMGVFALVTVLPALQRLFMLTPLGRQEYASLAIAVGVWVFAVRAAWRGRLLSRYLRDNLS